MENATLRDSQASRTAYELQQVAGLLAKNRPTALVDHVALYAWPGVGTKAAVGVL